ncbi:MAG: hypothetical protein ABIJ00_09795 [Candidatus Eisenbacteria bacterium]
MRKRLVMTAWLAVVGLAILQFPYGRLFPWSPVKPGYVEIPFAKVLLVAPKGFMIEEDLADIDGIVRDVESFHGLEFRKPLRVILTGSTSDRWRFTWTRGAGLYASRTGSVVALPSALPQSEGGNFLGLLRYGLASAILFQNTSFSGRSMLPKWLVEGLPAHYASPGEDNTRQEFLRLAVDESYYFDIPGADYQIQRIPAKARDGFVAMEYRYFLEYLVDRHGIDRVMEYARRLLEEPGLAGPLFHQVFGVYLGHAADGFKQVVLSRDRPGAEQLDEGRGARDRGILPFPEISNWLLREHHLLRGDLPLSRHSTEANTAGYPVAGDVPSVPHGNVLIGGQ